MHILLGGLVFGTIMLIIGIAVFMGVIYLFSQFAKQLISPQNQDSVEESDEKLIKVIKQFNQRPKLKEKKNRSYFLYYKKDSITITATKIKEGKFEGTIENGYYRKMDEQYRYPIRYMIDLNTNIVNKKIKDYVVYNKGAEVFEMFFEVMKNELEKQQPQLQDLLVEIKKKKISEDALDGTVFSFDKDVERIYQNIQYKFDLIDKEGAATNQQTKHYLHNLMTKDLPEIERSCNRLEEKTLKANKEEILETLMVIEDRLDEIFEGHQDVQERELKTKLLVTKGREM